MNRLTLTPTLRSRLFAHGCKDDWIGTIDRDTGKITHEGVVYRTHNAFATAHRRAARPDILPCVNAWKYVDVSDRNGVWYSLDRIHKIAKEGKWRAAPSNVVPAPRSIDELLALAEAEDVAASNVVPAPLSNAPELVIPSWSDVRARLADLDVAMTPVRAR
jgi:hypothetical protein